jgi:hypothetical protein
MPLNKEQFLNQFTRQALDERISLFVGAGASANAGYPSWYNLFKPLAKELGTPLEESINYYRVAQYYSNKFGQAELKKRINEIINKNDFYSPLINELIDIGFTNIWTTNFDNVLELNYSSRNILINKVFRDADLSNVELNKRINIYKMNGDISNPEGIVATQKDYEEYSESHRMMLMFLKRELISSTFLFIGYSFTDNLVMDCLSEITRYLGDAAPYHYTIMKNDNSNPYFNYFIDDLERRYHIRVLLVNEYTDIYFVLNELNQKIRSKKVFISGAFRSFEQNIEEYSHNLSRSITTQLLSNDYRIVNGIGRHFGTHIIGYANEYLAKKGIKDKEKYIIVRPFVGMGEKSLEDKKKLREEVIGGCGSAIFVFGDYNQQSPNPNSGVQEEFEIAMDNHKTIIPVAYPGMRSEVIWNYIKNNITQFPYLEKNIASLTSECDTNKLAEIIVYILDSVQDLI